VHAPEQDVDRLVLSLGMALSCLWAGCGPGGPDRAVVSGTVIYQGKPVEQGRIAFFPVGETNGPQAVAEIVGGTYRLENKGGVVVGRHRVEIRGRRIQPRYYEVPETQRDRLFDQGPPTEQYLPPKYNARSELEVTIPAGKTEVTRDFRLP